MVTKTYYQNQIFGTEANEFLAGSALNDYVLAGDGNDWVSGYAGNDYIEGGFGNDTILGGDGNDVLQGQNGNDVLNGGAGNDIIWDQDDGGLLTGGSGSDEFKFQIDVLSSGLTVIQDFTPGTDKLSFADYTYGTHDFTEFKSHAQQVGSNVVIDREGWGDSHGQIILQNVQLADIHAKDVQFIS